MDTRSVRVINAAGKLTALGGSAQTTAVAAAQAEAAGQHVDLAALRRLAGEEIARLTGAEAACVTSGAAAGVAIGIAALVTAGDPHKVQRLPETAHPHPVLLLAGHDINFGAPITQLIRMGGGMPTLIGSVNNAGKTLVEAALANVAATAFLYVKSHHCVQDNMAALPDCIAACRAAQVPLFVDAAAEEDLRAYIAAGADLVTYSGGKAIAGPTTGFIAGRRDLVDACEAQFAGIARTMKVGKEGILGLLAALAEYGQADEIRSARLAATNQRLLDTLAALPVLTCALKADEAGRAFSRVTVAAYDNAFDIRDLVAHLAAGEPSIRTRNHHVDQGYLMIDPRELGSGDVDLIAERIRVFASAQAR